MPFTRRSLLIAGGVSCGLVPAAPLRAAEPSDELASLETRLGGRIGLAARARGGPLIERRGFERFPLCSTFKLLAAALVLHRVDRGEERLDRRVAYGPGDLVSYSPVTERHAGEGMMMADICRAAVTRSDNTAGNLMLASFGGPAGLTAFARRLDDDVTRLDRIETALNEALPDDPRDTTAPAAMLGLMDRLLLGETLSETSRRQLDAWLGANETGAARIRAAVPSGWAVGDKTGTGERGAAGDVAILRPPGGAPNLIAIYLHGSTRPAAELNAAIAASARIAVKALSAV